MTEPSKTSNRRAAEGTKPKPSDPGLDKAMSLAGEIMAEDRDMLRKLSTL